MSAGIRAIAALSMTACFVFASCEAENTNDVSCAPADCTASCTALGYTSGACAEDACECGIADSDSYTWNDGGIDTSADASASAFADRG